MKLFKNRGHSLGRFRCITLDDEGQERCLSGARGEIWASTQSNLYFAFKILPSGDEKFFTFTNKELPRWIKALEIPPNPNDQLVWANNPNLRYKQFEA